MLTLTQNIEFKTDRYRFQRKLSQDLNKIKTNNNVLTAADKTTNFWMLDAPAYKKLLDTTITKAYKKAPPKTACKIISEEKKIAKSIGLDNRI